MRLSSGGTGSSAPPSSTQRSCSARERRTFAGRAGRNGELGDVARLLFRFRYSPCSCRSNLPARSRVRARGETTAWLTPDKWLRLPFALFFSRNRSMAPWPGLCRWRNASIGAVSATHFFPANACARENYEPSKRSRKSIRSNGAEFDVSPNSVAQLTSILLFAHMRT